MILRQRLEALPPKSIHARNIAELLERIAEFSLRLERETMAQLSICPIAKELFTDIAQFLGGSDGSTSPWAFLGPFNKELFQATDDFKSIKALQDSPHHRVPEAPDAAYAGCAGMAGCPDIPSYMLLHTYAFIMASFYGVPLSPPSIPPVTDIDPASGRTRAWELELSYEYATISSPEGLPLLSAEEKAEILENLGDIPSVMAILPPSRFRIEGLFFCRYREATRHWILDELKRLLAGADALTGRRGLGRAGELVGELLGKPGLDLGLAAVMGDEVLVLSPSMEACDERCISSRPRRDYAGTRFEQALATGQVAVANDLAATRKGAFEEELAAKGIASFAAIPLRAGRDAIGLLTLFSRKRGSFSLMDALALGEVLPDLAVSLSRGVERFGQEVRDFIQRRWTSIHPSVEWRFREEAAGHILSGHHEEADCGHGIAFEGVWPLYAVSDVRGSSSLRNEAIRADLEIQLSMARRAVTAASAFASLPALAEGAYRIDRRLEGLRDGVSSGEEIELLSFIRRELEPLVDSLPENDPETALAVASYRAGIDPAHGTVYDRRKAFDQSVERMNGSIASYLEREQAAAQAMFPHYFDRSSTDGVDMSMYIGPSLAGKRPWKPFYLRNLRLWQLMAVCGVARLSHRLRAELPMSLSMTHLIVVQDMPIGIKFSEDEKRFVVDGAYNIRYEILKKRIDKAVIKGGGERLTQPDKVAIVYTQATERSEYEAFLDFLSSAGLVKGAVEHLELEDLQGVSGLRALRVEVDMEGAPGPEEGIIERISRDAVAGRGLDPSPRASP